MHVIRFAAPLIKSFLVPLAFCLGSTSIHAARPMITDDARTVDAKACQLETWVKSNRDSTEYWVLPACNFTGNLELTLGGARGEDTGGARTGDVVIQGKAVFRPLEPNGWAWGLGFGNVRHPEINTQNNLIGDLYAYVPASFSFRDDRFVLHSNIGWLHEKKSDRDRLTWGIGSETQLNERTWLIAETFGQNGDRPLYQAGFRYWIVPGHVQLDTTHGDRLGSDTRERWFSIGMRLLSAPFLP
jgi:hypothetical protein